MSELFDKQGACISDSALREQWRHMGMADRHPYVRPVSGVAMLGIKAMQYANELKRQEIFGSMTPAPSRRSLDFVVGQPSWQIREIYRYVVSEAFIQHMSVTDSNLSAAANSPETDDFQTIVARVCGKAEERVNTSRLFAAENPVNLLGLINYVGIALRIEDCFKKPLEA